VTGTTIDANDAAIRLARSRPAVLFATAGVHPHHATELDDAAFGTLQAQSGDPTVVAVGECGLDYFRDYSPRPVQRQAFERQLELAAGLGKPVFLHQREAHADFVEIMSDIRSRLDGGVAHCFTGGPRELSDCLELDLHIGVTGWVCDERRGAELRAALPQIPLDRLLLETDAPYLLPRTLRPRPKSRRNEPCWLPHVATFVAGLMGRDPEEVAATATANTERLFGLPGD
jgi:TatD DNase family protein